jgi:hypothetical protein
LPEACVPRRGRKARSAADAAHNVYFSQAAVHAVRESEDKEMNRWWLTISTTAAVVLFTIGAQAALERQSYVLAGVSLLFAFIVPLQSEALRETLLRRPKI